MRQFPFTFLLAGLMTLAAAAAFAEEAALPGLKAEDAPAAAPAKDSCLVPGPGAAAAGCAGAYQRVSDGFLEGYKAMDAWVGSASAQVAGSAEKVAGIEKSIRDNESQVTGLKLQRTKDAKAKLKELDKANRALWKELDAARREQDALCKGFTRAAAAKVKELVADVQKRLSEAQKAAN